MLCCAVYRAEGYSMGLEEIAEKRKLIPDDVDVLITHPPRMLLVACACCLLLPLSVALVDGQYGG